MKIGKVVGEDGREKLAVKLHGLSYAVLASTDLCIQASTASDTSYLPAHRSR